MPLKISIEKVIDCSRYLESPRIAQGIFNEVLTASRPAPVGPRCVELRKDDSALFCRVHCFSMMGSSIESTELAIQPHDNGTLIVIQPEALEEACKLANPLAHTYFRLRIYLPKLNPFVKVIKNSYRLLQISYDEIEYIDFRMNEARTLPPSIEKMMRRDREIGSVALTLVAFLTALPVKSQLSTSNAPSHKMRLLEDDPWTSYVPGGIPKGMIVYHWKKEADGGTTVPVQINDFTAFVKLQTRWSDFRSYLLAFLIGVVGNLLASFLSFLVPSIWTLVIHPASNATVTRPAVTSISSRPKGSVGVVFSSAASSVAPISAAQRGVGD